MRSYAKRCAIALILVTGLLITAGFLIAFVPNINNNVVPSVLSTPSDWRTWGQNTDNTHNNAVETRFSVNNAENINIMCIYDPMCGEIFGYITTAGDNIGYLVSSHGCVQAFIISTCQPIWNTTMDSYTGRGAVDYSRTAPAIDGDYLYLGSSYAPSDGCVWIKLNRHDGSLVWVTDPSLVNSHIACVVTNSPIVTGNYLYAGTSSIEEAFAAFRPNYVCCSFIGNVLALDTDTGVLIWKTDTLRMSNRTGYAGNAVWGSQFSIDFSDDTINIGTGNNYKYPADIQACLNASDNNFTLCIDLNGNMVDSIAKVDRFTGAVKWSNSLLGFDAWTVACILGPNPGNCPVSPGPDYDFGQAPMRWIDAIGRKLVGSGQKSGIFWALDELTGQVVWSNAICPGGTSGGLQWGSALDQNGIYIACSNSDYEKYTLLNNEIVCAGSWALLDKTTGVTLWTVPDPASPRGNANCDTYRASFGRPLTSPPNNSTGIITGDYPSMHPMEPLFVGDPKFARSIAPVSVSNGLVYLGSLNGGFYIANSANGQILRSFNLGAGINSGATIANGKIVIGVGYTVFGQGIPGTPLVYVFDV